MSAEYVAGVDIGGTNIRIGVFDVKGGKIEGLETHSTAEVLKGSKPLEQLAGLLFAYCRSAEVSAIALGIPGTLDRSCEVVYNTPNTPCLNGMKLRYELESRLQIPVFLENDIVMLLYGDLFNLKIKNEGCIFGCYIGTGLGSALFAGGGVFKGKNGVCELGHIPVSGRFDLCTCGNYGCAENYVSGRYLKKLRDKMYPETHISGLFPKICGTKEYYEYIETLSVVLAGAINVVDPDVLILGGGVASMEGFPKKELFDSIYRRTMKPLPAESLNIIYSQGGADTGVLGAALYALGRARKLYG